MYLSIERKCLISDPTQTLVILTPPYHQRSKIRKPACHWCLDTWGRKSEQGWHFLEDHSRAGENWQWMWDGMPRFWWNFFCIVYSLLVVYIFENIHKQFGLYYSLTLTFLFKMYFSGCLFICSLSSTSLILREDFSLAKYLCSVSHLLYFQLNSSSQFQSSFISQKYWCFNQLSYFRVHFHFYFSILIDWVFIFRNPLAIFSATSIVAPKLPNLSL